MTNKGKLNLLLLIIIALLITILVYKPGKDDKDKKLSQIDKTTINQIRLERINAEPIEFKKQNDRWYMVAPFQKVSKKDNTEGLLDLLDYGYHDRYPIKDLELKTYGLDIPRAVIVYNNTYRFEFGNTEPLNKYRYLKTDEHLFLVEDYFQHRILGPATSFIDTKIIPEKVKIKQLSMPGLSLKLNDATWQVDPKPKKYSNDQANALIDNWQHAHANGIQKKTDLKVDGEISLTFTDDSKITFALSQNKEGFYLIDSDANLMYKMSEEQRRDLLELPAFIETDNLPAADAVQKPATKE